MISFIKTSAVLLGLLMLYMTITTSVESNLFAEWSSLMAIPWMRATLVDFYINIVFIFLWVVVKERSVGSRALWLVLLVCLGSMATAAYVYLQAHRMKPGDGLREFFLPVEMKD